MEVRGAKESFWFLLHSLEVSEIKMWWWGCSIDTVWLVTSKDPSLFMLAGALEWYHPALHLTAVCRVLLTFIIWINSSPVWCTHRNGLEGGSATCIRSQICLQSSWQAGDPGSKLWTCSQGVQGGCRWVCYGGALKICGGAKAHPSTPWCYLCSFSSDLNWKAKQILSGSKRGI